MKEMTLGKYIREFRKSKGYTIIQLSELSGVSNPYISQIENGKFVPSPEILEKLSKALNISHLELMAIAGYIEGAIDLQKENERLREALEFYADKENWERHLQCEIDVRQGQTLPIWDPSAIEFDEGETARRALGDDK